MSETVESKLARLAELQAQKDVFMTDKQRLIDEIMQPVKDALAEVEGEYALMASISDEEISALETEIKTEVLKIGKTQRGGGLMAMYVKGRAGGYDTAKLDGMAAIIPQILTAKKPDGEPTVRIQSVK